MMFLEMIANWWASLFPEPSFAVNPRYLRPIQHWTDEDQLNEERLYLSGRTAFWLFPERWADGPSMKFDDGSWQPKDRLAHGIDIEVPLQWLGWNGPDKAARDAASKEAALAIIAACEAQDVNRVRMP